MLKNIFPKILITIKHLKYFDYAKVSISPRQSFYSKMFYNKNYIKNIFIIVLEIMTRQITTKGFIFHK